jgi:hypothetical protein
VETPRVISSIDYVSVVVISHVGEIFVINRHTIRFLIFKRDIIL